MRKTLYFIAFVLVCSFIPIWTSWSLGPWEITGDNTTLWLMVPHMVENVKQSSEPLQYLYERELPNCAVFVAVSVIGFVFANLVDRKNCSLSRRVCVFLGAVFGVLAILLVLTDFGHHFEISAFIVAVVFLVGSYFMRNKRERAVSE